MGQGRGEIPDRANRLREARRPQVDLARQAIFAGVMGHHPRGVLGLHQPAEIDEPRGTATVDQPAPPRETSATRPMESQGQSSSRVLDCSELQHGWIPLKAKAICRQILVPCGND